MPNGSSWLDQTTSEVPDWQMPTGDSGVDVLTQLEEQLAGDYDFANIQFDDQGNLIGDPAAYSPSALMPEGMVVGDVALGAGGVDWSDPLQDVPTYDFEGMHSFWDWGENKDITTMSGGQLGIMLMELGLPDDYEEGTPEHHASYLFGQEMIDRLSMHAWEDTGGAELQREREDFQLRENTIWSSYQNWEADALEQYDTNRANVFESYQTATESLDTQKRDALKTLRKKKIDASAQAGEQSRMLAQRLGKTGLGGGNIMQQQQKIAEQLKLIDTQAKFTRKEAESQRQSLQEGTQSALQGLGQQFASQQALQLQQATADIELMSSEFETAAENIFEDWQQSLVTIAGQPMGSETAGDYNPMEAIDEYDWSGDTGP